MYIEPRHEALLKQFAEARGTSVAELIRQAIDRQIAGGQARFVLPDPTWEEARAFMLSLHARGPCAGQERTWMREDLHEEG